MKVVHIEDKTAEFLQALVKRLETQENHGTAAPYYFVVRCEKEIAVPEGTTGNSKYFDRTASCSYTEQELRDALKGQLPEDTTGLDVEFDSYVVTNCTKYDVDTVDVYENVFLTREAYDWHMKLNGHNYRHYKSVSPYLLHAFRNPEMENVIKALKELGHTISDAPQA